MCFNPCPEFTFHQPATPKAPKLQTFLTSIPETLRDELSRETLQLKPVTPATKPHKEARADSWDKMVLEITDAEQIDEDVQVEGGTAMEEEEAVLPMPGGLVDEPLEPGEATAALLIAVCLMIGWRLADI